MTGVQTCCSSDLLDYRLIPRYNAGWTICSSTSSRVLITVHVVQCWQSGQAYHAAVSFLMFVRVVSAKRSLADKQGRVGHRGKTYSTSSRSTKYFAYLLFCVLVPCISGICRVHPVSGCRDISCFDRGPRNDDESTRSCDLTRLHPESCIWLFTI